MRLLTTQFCIRPPISNQAIFYYYHYKSNINLELL